MNVNAQRPYLRLIHNVHRLHTNTKNMYCLYDTKSELSYISVLKITKVTKVNNINSIESNNLRKIFIESAGLLVTSSGKWQCLVRLLTSKHHPVEYTVYTMIHK